MNYDINYIQQALTDSPLIKWNVDPRDPRNLTTLWLAHPDTDTQQKMGYRGSTAIWVKIGSTGNTLMKFASDSSVRWTKCTPKTLKRFIAQIATYIEWAEKTYA